MGVYGVTTLLHKEGWIPSEAKSEDECLCSSSKLFKTWNPSFAFFNQGLPLQQIRPQSLLLIDGNGLAFFLLKVAYARNLRSIFKVEGRCPAVGEVSPGDISKALPSMLPLSLVEELANEFISQLRLFDIRLKVYWDGRSRRFKTATDQKRREQREEEWSALQQYCIHGSLPNEKNICRFLSRFPVPRLFLRCVRKALQRAQVEMVHCEEEADVELARAASGDSNAFVLGQDSDFFFFKDIQYIPFDCIYTAQPHIYACVGTRAALAKLLGLRDEQMIEFAILAGNDYVQNISIPRKKKDEKYVKDPIAIIRYLQEQDDDFRVGSKAQEAALSFVRALYNLKDLDSFPLKDIAYIKNGDGDDTTDILNVSLPKVLYTQGRVTIEDSTVSEAILRCLGTYIENTEGNDDPPLDQEHLNSYLEMISTQSNQSSHLVLKNRPRWKDIRAAFAIEACISRVLEASTDSLLVRMVQPSELFDHYKFHSTLESLRPGSSFEDISEVENDSLPEEPEPAYVERKRLPIDDHSERILRNIENNRVTIIHGETGCGKSSRVPIMLLEAPSPDPSLPEVKFFIAQPRRIAAKGLVERIRSCEPLHREKFALRMGHGWKEYETGQTQAWFVTTGYLTRLLANHPENFDDCTHLIIDEVHERSVDTDILCLLCRRLLSTNKKIRLVLMSATLATKLYKEYFDVPDEPIHVGVRTFPIQEFFVEDLIQFNLPPNETKAALAIQKECEQKRCNSAPFAAELSKRFSLAARLAKIVGKPGSSVLIFVPGMNEIIAITEFIDNFHVSGIRYTTCPIHSDIPFEDQMEAFNEPKEDEVKIVIATNAAESSVTLPTVDHVICLGLCRQIIYNPTSHRQMLSPCWISRASAKQRAGRTGRVRPGSVYRLYTRNAFESFMEEFDPGEIKRIPLDAIILMLKQMLHEEVVPVLQSCIEPPNLDTIGRSLQSLHRSNFLAEANDQADITSLGSFVSSLGIDLSLGSFIGLGIQFGVAAEAIEMAAIMSFPKTPFQISSPLFHDPATFNEIISQAYVSRCHFDANLYSEPLALMNAIWDYHVAPNKNKWCMHYRIAIARMRQLVATRNSLRKRVADYFGINEDVLMLESPPAHLPHAKIVILRLLQIWVFSDTIIESGPSKNHLETNGSLSLSLQKGKSQKIERDQLEQVLIADRHKYDIVSIADLDQSGNFECLGFEFRDFMSVFGMKLVSYMIESSIDMVCVYDNQDFVLYLNDEKEYGDNIAILFDSIRGAADETLLIAKSDANMKRRGIFERKCGMWSVEMSEGNPKRNSDEKRYREIHVLQRDHDFISLCHLMNDALNSDEVDSVMFWEFPQGKAKKKKKKDPAFSVVQRFSIIARGNVQNVAKFDLQDLLGTQKIHSIVRGENNTKIRFLAAPNQPFPYDGPKKELFATSHVTESSSWNRPLFQDIPEGARLLCVLVSSQRRGGQRLRFDKGKENGDPEDTRDVTFDKAQSDITRRWRRLGTDGSVFVPENTVPASATCTTSPLFACCSNALDIKGGMLKVEGLTLLPPDPLFLLLGFLSFGLQPNVAFTWGQMTQGSFSDNQDEMEKKKVRTAMSWLTERKEKISEVDLSENDVYRADAKERIRMAIAFHNSCSTMGEILQCCPEKVQALCDLFSMVDGYEISLWESLDEKAFTPENLLQWKRKRRTSHGEQKKESTNASKSSKAKQPKNKSNDNRNATATSSMVVQNQSSNAPVATRTTSPQEESITQGGEMQTKAKKEKLQTMRTFPDKIMQDSKRWFATSQTEQLGSTDFPSSNILSLLFQKYSDEVLGSNTGVGSVTLNAENWEILEYKSGSGRLWYQARFINDIIPILPILGRGKNKLSKWMKKQMRPSTVAGAKECVPPGIPCSDSMIFHLSNDRPILLYQSIEAAVRMESAFWLERQFCYVQKTRTRHWYQQNLQEMIQLLKRNAAPSNKPSASRA